MTTSESYEVHALRYSSREATKSHEFHRFGFYKEPDAEIGMDYFFWLIRNNNRTVLLDCGFNKERSEPKGRFTNTEVEVLLNRMDVKPEDVDHLVISHMHYDHVGNTHLFPNATITMTRQEYDFWCGPEYEHELLRNLVDSREVEIVKSLREQERLQVFDDSVELYPGITASWIGGHTPGQLTLEVTGASKQILLASDTIHYYDEMNLDRPFDLFTNLPELYRAYAKLREIDARPDTVVVSGHDPRDSREYASPLPEVFDLNAPLS